MYTKRNLNRLAKLKQIVMYSFTHILTCFNTEENVVMNTWMVILTIRQITRKSYPPLINTMFTGMISRVIVGVYDVRSSLENIQCICCIRQSSERFLNTAKVTRTKRTKMAFYGQEFLIEILK